MPGGLDFWGHLFIKKKVEKPEYGSINPVTEIMVSMSYNNKNFISLNPLIGLRPF